MYATSAANGDARACQRGNSQEAERVDGPGRRPKPRRDRVAVGRELRPKRRCMAGKHTPIRASVGDRDPARYGRGTPTTLPGDARREATLPVDAPHQLIDVDELGLQLDDEQAARGWMPCKTVDDPTLAVHREGDLRLEDPSRKGDEPDREGLMQRRVACVDEPPEVPAMPADRQVQSRVEGYCDRSNVVDSDPGQSTTFDKLNDGARHDRRDRHLLLRQAASKPDRKETGTDPTIFHHGEDARRRSPDAYAV